MTDTTTATNTVTTIDRDEVIGYIWDAYKDAHGIRPRFMSFNTMSDNELLELMDRVSNEVALSIRMEEEIQQENQNAIESKIVQLQNMGANNVSVAIKWLLDAEDLLDASVNAIRFELNVSYEFAQYLHSHYYGV